MSRKDVQHTNAQMVARLLSQQPQPLPRMAVFALICRDTTAVV